MQPAFADRRWPQARSWQASLAESSNCGLCVELGLGDPSDPAPKFKWMLAHRILTCPVTEECHNPQWILDKTAANLRPDSLSGPSLPACTQGAAASAGSLIGMGCATALRVWPCSVYVDGSRLHAERDVFNMSAQHGWGFSRSVASSSLLLLLLVCPRGGLTASMRLNSGAPREPPYLSAGWCAQG